MSWFIFNGIISESMGVVVREYPPIIRARKRVETVVVPGRSGELTLATGEATYDTVLRPCKCYVRPDVDYDALVDWLTGGGELVLGSEPNFIYDAKIEDEISLDKIMRGHQHRDLVIPFLCQPFKRHADVTTTLTAAGSLYNPGHVASRPQITVVGSGTVVLTVGDTEMTITGLDGTIIIDSDLGMGISSDGTENLSSMLSGDWPRLARGANAISWTGTVTSVAIVPRWRYL